MPNYNLLQDSSLITERALAVLTEAWRLLPPLKHDLDITSIGLEDLDMKHGSWSPDDHTLMLSTRLFVGENEYQLLHMDIDGNTPPLTTPYTTRALHTVIHELGHALGTLTGADDVDAWRRISGWVERPDDPQGTQRYHEGRPGWGGYISDWRHTSGCWWCRDYSRRSPYEDFADCVAHAALGWFDFIQHPMGREKLAYLRQTIWRDKPPRNILGMAARWGTHIKRTVDAVKKKRERKSFPLWMVPHMEALREALLGVNEEQRDFLLAHATEIRDNPAGILPLLLARDAHFKTEMALGPTLFGLSREAWAHAGGDLEAWERAQADTVLRYTAMAAESYTQTTANLLQEALAKQPEATMAHVEDIIQQLIDRNNAIRVQQVVETEAQRVTQAAVTGVAEEAGDYLVWRTADDTQVCEFCLALEGRRIRAGEPYVDQGATLRGADGKTMVMGYDDLAHPPLHPACRCELLKEA